jgi:hypothetical protein
MRIHKRASIVGAALASIGLGVTLAWADGTTSGRITSVTERDIKVLVPPVVVPSADPKAKKKTATGSTYVFLFDADTEVTIADGKMRVPDLQKGWQVSVTYRQDPDDTKRPPAKTPAPKPGTPVNPTTGTVAGIDPLRNKNPMTATRVTVTTQAKTVQFIGWDGTDAVNIEYDEDVKTGAAKTKTVKKKIKAAAQLLPNFRLTIEGQEADRAVLMEGSFVQAEFVDNNARVPQVFKIAAKKDALRNK